MTGNTNPANLASQSAKRWDNGGEFGALLQPKHQVAFVADLAAISGGEAPTEAEHNATRTAINSLKAALVTVGIMKSS